MTILIAASTPEGLVLAADSRTTRRPGDADHPRPAIATNRARKVFPLTDTVGAATHGCSHIQGHTIASLADRFRWRRPPRASENVSTVVAAFTAFIRELREVERAGTPKGSPPEPVGFLIAGYDAHGVGKLYEVDFPKGSPQLLSTTEAPNYHWRGQGDAISRLMKGVDPGIDQTHVRPEATKTLRGLEYAVALRQMSLDDAVDFVRLLARVAIGIDRFTTGTLAGRHRDQVVGGRLRIATVTLDGFRWASG